MKLVNRKQQLAIRAKGGSGSTHPIYYFQTPNSFNSERIDTRNSKQQLAIRKITGKLFASLIANPLLLVPATGGRSCI